MKNKFALMCLTSLIVFSGACHSQTTQAGDTQDTEAISQRYIESFRKSGVPTGEAVTAAVSKAKATNKIPDWEFAARLANSYANVIGAMKEHYSALYRSSLSVSRSGNSLFLDRAVEYEKSQNIYLAIRNDAYLSQAELHLKAGNKSAALSLAMTSMRLTGDSPDYKAEEMIKRIIELK